VSAGDKRTDRLDDAAHAQVVPTEEAVSDDIVARTTLRWKLTNAQHQTYGGCEWWQGVTHEASGEGELCGPGWIHVYTSPRLAVLLNPIHANFGDPVLWRVECCGEVKTNHRLKEGWTRVTTIKIVKAPVYSHEQRIAFAIWCAAQLCCDPAWSAWADGWISGQDRTLEAAWSAGSAVGSAEAWGEAAWAAAWAAGAGPLDLDAIALRALEWQP